MHFDVALNVAWLFLGILTFVLMLRASRCVRSKAVSRFWLRIAGAVAIVGTLFPYVSATDDLVWLEASNTRSEHQDSRSTGSSNSNSGLLSLYHVSQSSVGSGTVRVACVLVFLAMTIAPILRTFSYVSLRPAGRSPPDLSAI